MLIFPHMIVFPFRCIYYNEPSIAHELNTLESLACKSLYRTLQSALLTEPIVIPSTFVRGEAEHPYAR